MTQVTLQTHHHRSIKHFILGLRSPQLLPARRYGLAAFQPLPGRG